MSDEWEDEFGDPDANGEPPFPSNIVPIAKVTLKQVECYPESIKPTTQKPMLMVSHQDELMTSLEVDEVSIQTTENGVIVLAYAHATGKKLGPADFLQALAKAKVIKPKPIGPEFSHLPAGVYTVLIQNAALPIEKGFRGGEGIEGYYVPLDPEEAVMAIQEALRGDAWDADEEDVAGEPGHDCVKVLFRRV